VTPVVIFDGGKLNMKSNTEENRENNREKKKKEALYLL